MTIKASPLAALVLSVAVSAGAACSASGPEQPKGSDDGPSPIGTAQQEISFGTLPPPGPTTVDTPIGLALDIEDGAPQPLQVRKNQRFYVNQIDMRAHIQATVDEGVKGLAKPGNDFSNLDWRNTQFVDESFESLPNADGTFTRRRFYRKSNWMDLPSIFVIEQLDAAGHVIAVPTVIDTGLEYQRTPIDSFFTRRLRAIQWANDCATNTDCSHATSFMEEALVELRYANGPNPSFKIATGTTGLRVTWSNKLGTPYVIPVQQIENPTWDYGFNVNLAVKTPTNADGTYSPGTPITFKFTLTDGSGKRLHDPGTMPTFLDFFTGNDPAGIQYWQVDEPTITYYRRKHKEKQMMLSFEGPNNALSEIHTEVNFPAAIFGNPDGALSVATPAVDGYFDEVQDVPTFETLLDPTKWADPVSDEITMAIPPDAKPGTYNVVMKARRSYLGEQLPRATTMTIQVGTTHHTTQTLKTGGCENCHAGGGELSRVGHGLDVNHRETCSGCHAPANFEPENSLYVRQHFVHSRTDRLDKPLFECKNCHLAKDSIQRTSKSACLSCHTSYPQDHVVKYGPITDMFIGGGPESFNQCSTTCHTNHPGSGL